MSERGPIPLQKFLSEEATKAANNVASDIDRLAQINQSQFADTIKHIDEEQTNARTFVEALAQARTRIEDLRVWLRNHQITLPDGHNLAFYLEPISVKGVKDMITDIPDEKLDKRLRDIGVETRAVNALRKAGIETVGQYMAIPEENILAVRKFGQVSHSRTKSIVHKFLGINPS